MFWKKLGSSPRKLTKKRIVDNFYTEENCLTLPKMNRRENFWRCNTLLFWNTFAIRNGLKVSMWRVHVVQLDATFTSKRWIFSFKLDASQKIYSISDMMKKILFIIWQGVVFLFEILDDELILIQNSIFCKNRLHPMGTFEQKYKIQEWRFFRSKINQNVISWKFNLLLNLTFCFETNQNLKFDRKRFRAKNDFLTSQQLLSGSLWAMIAVAKVQKHLFRRSASQKPLAKLENTSFSISVWCNFFLTVNSFPHEHSTKLSEALVLTHQRPLITLDSKNLLD